MVFDFSLASTIPNDGVQVGRPSSTMSYVFCFLSSLLACLVILLDESLLVSQKHVMLIIVDWVFYSSNHLRHFFVSLHRTHHWHQQHSSSVELSACLLDGGS
jgi:hypothetical protein